MPERTASTEHSEGAVAAASDPHSAHTPGLRLDKWLWFARIVKSRTLAATLITTGKVRINRIRIAKASQVVRPGDVITLAVHQRVLVLQVLALGKRRGPASEAQTLYEDLSPPPPPRRIPAKSEADVEAAHAHTQSGPVATRDAGAGRPTKRERRLTDRLRTHNGEID